MKQLKFEHVFAEAIIAHEKVATIRVNDDKDMRVGDKIQLVDKVDTNYPTSWQIPGELNVLAIEAIQLNDLSSEQIGRAESFKSKSDMIQTFRRFYGDHISKDTEILVMDFDYTSYEQPKKYLDNSASGSAGVSNAVLYADGGSRGNPGPSRPVTWF